MDRKIRHTGVLPKWSNFMKRAKGKEDRNTQTMASLNYLDPVVSAVDLRRSLARVALLQMI